MVSKLCHPLEGGIVFEVAFGRVSDGVGASRIEWRLSQTCHLSTSPKVKSA
jgi:hypothetical protein